MLCHAVPSRSLPLTVSHFSIMDGTISLLSTPPHYVSSRIQRQCRNKIEVEIAPKSMETLTNAMPEKVDIQSLVKELVGSSSSVVVWYYSIASGVN